MNLYILLFVMITFILISFRRSNKYLIQPFLIMSGSFLIAITVCILNPQWDLNLTIETSMTIIFGIICFGFGQTIVKKITIKSSHMIKTYEYKYDYKENINAIPFILIIQIIFIIIYVCYIVRIGGGISLNVIQNARTWLLYNDMPKIYGHINHISFSIAAVYIYILSRKLLINKDRKGIVKNIIIISLYVVNEIISSSRSGLIYFFGYIMTVVIYFHQKQISAGVFNERKQQKKIMKIIIKIFIITMIIFVFLGNLTGKTSKLGVINMISTYFGGSIYNLNYYIEHKETFISPSLGYFTLPILNSILGASRINAINIDKYYFPINIIPTKYNIGVFSPTNLYSCFTKPITDYGEYGMLIFLVLLGMLYGIFYYHMAKSEDAGISLIFYGFLIMPLIGASAEYLFGTLLFSSAALYRVIYIFIFFKVCIKRIRYNRICE